LCVFCFFCMTACGLTEYYTLEPPKIIHESSYTSTDYTTRYVSFRTEENQDTGGEFTFDGTAVYYKIYNNYSTMVSRYTSILNVNSTSDYSAAAKRMIETYGYVPLNTDASTSNPLIGTASSDQVVTIRLTNYNESASENEAHKAQISINGTYRYAPRRYGLSACFDFGRNSTKCNNEYTDDTLYALPASGDDDVTYGSAQSYTNGADWYVDLFAVSVGHDASYSKVYSLVLHLGSIGIDEGSVNN
nr:hypothetical protein [Treponema sp.]